MLPSLQSLLITHALARQTCLKLLSSSEESPLHQGSEHFRHQLFPQTHLELHSRLSNFDLAVFTRLPCAVTKGNGNGLSEYCRTSFISRSRLLAMRIILANKFFEFFNATISPFFILLVTFLFNKENVRKFIFLIGV